MARFISDVAVEAAEGPISYPHLYMNSLPNSDVFSNPVLQILPQVWKSLTSFVVIWALLKPKHFCSGS